MRERSKETILPLLDIRRLTIVRHFGISALNRCYPTVRCRVVPETLYMMPECRQLLPGHSRAEAGSERS